MRTGCRTKGVTLIEMLVATAIVTAFLAGATLAFVEMVRSNDRAQARLDAVANARTALDAMSLELKRARFGPPSDSASTGSLFIGFTEPGPTGDLIDNDSDGTIDEETFGGAPLAEDSVPDEDLDWNLVRDDKHANLGNGLFERPIYVTVRDKDDGHIDEDVKFTSASITFRTFPVPTGSSRREVSFYLGAFDGESNVLIQEVTEFEPTGEARTTTGPLAHDVLSFGALFWDPVLAMDSSKNPWRRAWNAETQPQPPNIPASIYLSITIYSGTPLPLNMVAAGTKLNTVTLDTIVNVEAVLADPRYTDLRDLTWDLVTTSGLAPRSQLNADAATRRRAAR